MAPASTGKMRGLLLQVLTHLFIPSRKSTESLGFKRRVSGDGPSYKQTAKILVRTRLIRVFAIRKNITVKICKNICYLQLVY